MRSGFTVLHGIDVKSGTNKPDTNNRKMGGFEGKKDNTNGNLNSIKSISGHNRLFLERR